MTTLKHGDEHHVWFDSLDEMERELPKSVALGANRKRYSEILAGRGDGWCRTQLGVPSMAVANDAIANGSEPLLNQLQPLIERLRQALGLGTAAALQLDVRRRKLRRGDHGDNLDMGRVWGGELDTAWSRPVRWPKVSATQRYCTVFTDCAMPAYCDADDSLWRAAMSQCLVEILTRMGFSTEVWCGATGVRRFERGPYKHFCGVKIKDFTQPLNESRLAVMMHAMFYRSRIWAMYCDAPYQLVGSLGNPAQSGLVMPLRERAANGERVFRVSNVTSADSAVVEIQRIVDELKASSSAKVA